MKLTTRCPECQSSFEISPEQLQRRKGYIRCIYCAHIFDGYEAVVPDTTPQAAPARSVPAGLPPANQPAAPSASAAASPVASLSADSPFVESAAVTLPTDKDKPPADVSVRNNLIRRRQPVSGPVFSSSHSGPAASFQASVSPASSRSSPAFSVEAEVRAVDGFSIGRGVDDETPVSRFVAGGERVFDTPSGFAEGAEREDSDGAENTQGTEASAVYLEPRRSGEAAIPGFLESRSSAVAGPLVRFFWSVLLLAGLLLAAAQLVYIYRVQMASAVPFLRPLLEQACQAVSCTVDYSRQLSAITVTGTSLKAQAEASRPDRTLVLDFILHNNYERPQQWPALALDLKDAAGASVARLLLSPGHYLSTTMQQGPFPARSRARVSLPFSVQGVTVAGYQLTPYFP